MHIVGSIDRIWMETKMNYIKRINKQTVLLWSIYLCLLAVLWPHTAWAFAQFEPPTQTGIITAWLAAFFFEAVIAALTHKESIVIRSRRAWHKKIANPYAIGLLIAVGVSTMANMAHAVEYGGSLEIFGGYAWPFVMYAVGFGAILPLASLVFAWVLSGEEFSEQVNDNEATQLRKDLSGVQRELAIANRQAGRYAALMSENKKHRILAAAEIWPDNSITFYEQVTGASRAYISETLKNGRDV